MSDAEDWWRAHLPKRDRVIWWGRSKQNGRILMYRLPLWFFRTLGLLGLTLGPLGVLTGVPDSLSITGYGALMFAASYIFTVLEKRWRDDTVFVVLPDRAVAVSRQGIFDEVEIDKFLQFEQSQTGIHFPRRRGQWPFIDDPKAAYQGLKEAQRLHQ